MNPFKLTKESNSPSKVSLKNKNRTEMEAKFERLWLKDPEQFNPNRNIFEKLRVERTLTLIKSLNPPAFAKAVDLGMGWGHFTDALISLKYDTLGIDIATNALKHYTGSAKTSQDYVPYTRLEDNSFTLVLACDLIAIIPEEERRLALSEFARLLSKEGRLIISTPLDIYSEDALPRFLSLIETEFEVEELVPSYHSFSLKLPPLSRSLTLLLEKAAQFVKHEQAISHLIVLAKKRPLYQPPAEIPIERKAKKTVWE